MVIDQLMRDDLERFIDAARIASGSSPGALVCPEVEADGEVKYKRTQLNTQQLQ
jgi:hypothetical protein